MAPFRKNQRIMFERDVPDTPIKEGDSGTIKSVLNDKTKNPAYEVKVGNKTYPLSHRDITGEYTG